MTELPTLSLKKKKSEHAALVKRDSYGADLHHLDADRVIKTDPVENRYRRTLLLTKKDNSWGFTLQSYGIKHKKTDELEIMTYVDYVAMEGSACLAGMRRGDVILSINGEKVGDVTHQELVCKIRATGYQMRLVVLFEDCCRKVDLHDRYLKLKSVLKSKYEELKQLELKEMNIIEAYYQMKGWNRFEQLRQSILSRASTSSGSWDAYSLVSSPYNQHSTGHFDQWPSVSSLRSFSIGDDSSNLEETLLEYIDTDSESIGSCSNSSCDTGKLGMGRSRKSDSDLVTMYGGCLENVSYKAQLSKSSNTLHRAGYGDVGQGQGCEIQPEFVRIFHSLSEADFTTPKVDKAKAAEMKKVNSQKRSFPKRDQVFYSGENGKIIVPRICIEGQEVFTTLDDIDIITQEDKVQHDQTDFDKNVALDFARQTALLEQMDLASGSELGASNSKTLPVLPKNKSELTFRKRGSTWSNEKRPKRVELRHEILQDCSEFQRASSNTIKRSGHLCDSLSYEQLKSSVPDIYLPFHLSSCQIVYINERNESTQL